MFHSSWVQFLAQHLPEGRRALLRLLPARAWHQESSRIYVVQNVPIHHIPPWSMILLYSNIPHSQVALNTWAATANAGKSMLKVWYTPQYIPPKRLIRPVLVFDQANKSSIIHHEVTKDLNNGIVDRALLMGRIWTSLYTENKSVFAKNPMIVSLNTFLLVPWDARDWRWTSIGDIWLCFVEGVHVNDDYTNNIKLLIPRDEAKGMMSVIDMFSESSFNVKEDNLEWQLRTQVLGYSRLSSDNRSLANATPKRTSKMMLKHSWSTHSFCTQLRIRFIRFLLKLKNTYTPWSLV